MNGQQDSIPSEDEAAELVEYDDGSIGRVTWDGDPEAEMLEAEDEMAEGEAAEAQRDERRWKRPGAPLPFQFQVPLTGGAPALALPIGGPGSPIAATVPLGGAQPPAAPAAAPAAPATPPTSPPGSPVAPPAAPYAAPPDAPAAAPPAFPAAPAYQPAPGGEPSPVAVAAADFPLYVPPEVADAVHEAMQVAEVWQELALRSEAAAPSFAEDSAPEAESEAEGAEWGERVLAAAARSGGGGPRPPSSSTVLRSLTEGAMEGESEAGDGGPSSGLLGALGQMPSATALFNSLVDPDSAVRRREGLSRFFGERFMVLARPGEPLGEIRLRPGDLLLRVAQGEGWGHVAILTSPQLYRREDLADARLRGEGYPQLLPGRYVHVVEPGPRLRTESDRFARRLCNAADFVLPDTLLIRILPQTAEAAMPAGEAPGREPTAPSPGGRATLRKGDSGDAVRQAQRALNRIHADALALGLPGLPGCPLPEDGRFADSTEAAVTALQQQVLSDPSKWDGVIGPETWAQLTLLAGTGEPAPQQPAAPQRQGASRRPRRGAARAAVAAEASGLAEDEPTPSGAVAEGREVVATVPMLHGHVGTPPDLILRWNRMASVPQAVDVAIHLHGFSGRGAAMRLDADKEPRSGLDFANPDPPGEPGRTEPTLCLLPRGNYYGGRSGMGYDFPALITPEALRQLIDFALARFAARIGAAQVAMRRLLLTAHSGGGAPLMRILGHYDPDEVHVFDGLYSSAAPLVRWVTARLARSDAASAALRVLYIAGTGTAAQSESVARALAGLLSGSADPRTRRFRVEATRVVHNDIPRRFGWRLLLDAGSDLPLGSPPPTPHRRTPHHATPHPSAPPPPASTPDSPAPSTSAPPTPAPSAPTSSTPTSPAPAPPAHPAAGGLAQADVDRLGAITFGNAAEINAFFARGGASGFADWFNATLGGRAPFIRLGGGGGMRMPIAAAARARFDAFWDRIPLAYDQPRISVLEFAALMCITMNETDGDFASRAESSGRNQGGRTDAHGHHRGLAYFFDRIELRPGRWKASYNRLSGGRTAGSLFDDEAYIRAHGALGGAAQLARHGGEFGGAWLSEYYPQDSFSTDERASETEFIRQADFYKFRGRGVIQTTGRGGYAPFVRFVQSYSGSDAALLERQRRWSALSADDAASASTNDDWEAIFASPDTLARALAFHAGRASTDYRIMSRDAAVLADVPAPPSGRRRPAGRKGSVFYMGRRISGSYPYGAGEYRDRVFTLLRGILSLAGGAPLPAPAPSEPAPPAPTPPSSTEPVPAPPQGEPSRPASPSHPSAPRRGAVPAPDEATMHAQWDAHPRVHGHFSNSFARYSELAPLYAAQGVGDAAEYLDTNMVRLTFFGRHQDGHRDLVAPLRQAEEAMRGQTVSPPITSFGCLVPRPIRGTTNRLSNHALGRAFDLNPTGNPRITQAVDYLVIAAATGTDLHQLRRETDPTTLSRISRAFQDGFTEAWVSSQSQPDILAALQNRGTRERLNGYARHGICTLYVPLIQALIAAGLVWGGAWPSSKDFMHFELRR